MLRSASINALAAVIVLAAASAPAAAAETGSASFASLTAPLSPIAVSCVRPGPNGEGCTHHGGIRKGKLKGNVKPQADKCKKTNTTKECRDYIQGHIKVKPRPKGSSGQTAKLPAKIKGNVKPQADNCKKTNTAKECRDYVLGNKKPPVRKK